MDGPYRATKLWNEMLHTFKHGMPLRRHRKHMKVYDNCFSGAEAIQWLQIALKDNPNIKPGISKTQVRQLLTKFMKAGIFCSVCASNSSDAQEFKENEIYQFSTHNNGFNLLSAYEHIRLPAKTFEMSVQESRNVTNIDNKEDRLPSSSKIPPFLQTTRIPLENCLHKDYNLEVKHSHKRKESFSCKEKPANVLKGCEQNSQKENMVSSSQAFDSTRSVPIPPQKPQRRLEACVGITNPCSVSDSEGNPYDTAKYTAEENNILNGYKKLTDHSLESTAPPGHINDVSSNSEADIWDAWKMVFILRLETILAGMEEITALLPTNIRIDWLIRNVQEQVDIVSRSSSVESGLDEWPEDIINNYREQLAGVKEPLIMADLYNLITEAYLYVEHINNASTQFMCKSREIMLASRSVENLVLGMASPCASDVKTSRFISKGKPTAGSAVYCYETAFASDTPITRIVPQSTLKDACFSRQHSYSRSFRSSRERPPPDEQIKVHDRHGNLVGVVTETYPSRTVWRSKSSQDVKEAISNNITEKPTKEKSQNRSGRRPWRITRKHSDTSQKSSGLQHCRNKSGGYVNPALSQSLEDLSSQKYASQELDYVAALETLQTLMQHTHMTMNDRKNDRGLQESTCDLSSESGSYYTAASTPDRQKYSNVSLTKEHEQSKWKQPALGLGISVFQLLLLLVSPGSRCLLKRLLRCLHHLPTAINTEEAMQVIQSMTPNVLANEQESDKSMPFRVVRFLVTFYKEIFEVPVDLHVSVSKHLNQGRQVQKITYCEQVTSKQFEEQGLSGSQKALSELLDQILSDSRMSDKEKKRKLKMFRERYPNIYKQHFPGMEEDRINSEKSRGILQLPSLGKLKNIRI